ncbi:hypothetical protein [Brevibacillus sp. SYSU BS000544]|uniref:hypothetical protein n=1 Tax=Brevibacillus sp. SYSU BS000544 TaxID=3416443 RepID=UPI003CE4729A
MPSYTSDVKGLRTFEAFKLVKDESVWVAVGKTAQWNETETVPQVTEGTTLQELVALKRADQVAFVVPDPNGTIEQQGQKWKIISEQEAKSIDCRWVYIQVWLNYDQFPVVTYRQTGIYTGLALKPGVPANKQIITISDVADLGFFIVANNRSPIPREATQKESIEFIIEF